MPKRNKAPILFFFSLPLLKYTTLFGKNFTSGFPGPKNLRAQFSKRSKNLISSQKRQNKFHIFLGICDFDRGFEKKGKSIFGGAFMKQRKGSRFPVTPKTLNVIQFEIETLHGYFAGES